eukprot:gene8417-10002_t
MEPAGACLLAYDPLNSSSLSPQVACVVLAEFAPDVAKDKLAYFYGQAAEFTEQAQAASFLSSRCWGHPPRSIPLVMKHITFRCRTLDSGATVFKIDPRWHFEYSEEALGRSLEQLTCPVMLVHGENSHVPTELYSAHGLLGRLCKKVSAGSAEAFSVQEARKPEMLGIRPLPQYPTLDDAIKALAPRKIPTAQMIEEELAKLRQEDEVPSDEDEYGNCRTALAQDDPEYFGFVG